MKWLRKLVGRRTPPRLVVDASGESLLRQLTAAADLAEQRFNEIGKAERVESMELRQCALCSSVQFEAERSGARFQVEVRIPPENQDGLIEGATHECDAIGVDSFAPEASPDNLTRRWSIHVVIPPIASCGARASA